MNAATSEASALLSSDITYFKRDYDSRQILVRTDDAKDTALT